jgi:hypothetical protein
LQSISVSAGSGWFRCLPASAEVSFTALRLGKWSGRCNRNLQRFVVLLRSVHLDSRLTMALRSRHSIWCGCQWAVVAATALVPGCAGWNADRWDLSRLRDERAVEIEQRLTREQPVVKSPFQEADEQ